MFTWVQTEITEWTTLIPLAIVLVGGWAVVHTFHKTRAFIPVLAVALTTGVAAWASSERWHWVDRGQGTEPNRGACPRRPGPPGPGRAACGQRPYS